MENTGLISVIVPVYNVEKYLEKCIESVLAQRYRNFELLLINDGSTDSSWSICKRYAEKDERIKVFNKENGGASSARNFGLEIASGEYIYFLDSDDWLDIKAFEKMMECSGLNHADIIFFDAYAIDEETGKESTSNYSHKGNYPSDDAYQLMQNLMKNKEFRIAPWMFFIRKEVFDKSKLRFEEGIIYEDMIFTYQLFCEARKAAYLPEYLYYRRYRENSVMTAKITERNWKSALKVYNRVHEYWDGLPEDKKSVFHIVRCAYNVFNVYEKLCPEDKKIFQKEYGQFQKKVLERNAYNDTALKARCYSEWCWGLYKVLTKFG